MLRKFRYFEARHWRKESTQNQNGKGKIIMSFHTRLHDVWAEWIRSCAGLWEFTREADGLVEIRIV